MSKRNVNEVAKMLDVSTATIYKKTKKLKDRLEGMTTKEKGVIFFLPKAIEIIRQEITTAPKETLLSPIPVQMVDLSPVTTRLEGLEKAFMLMVTEIKGLRQENLGLRSDLQKALEYRPGDMPVTTEAMPTLSNIAEVRFNPPPASRQNIISQRKVSMLESVQITLNDVFCFMFGYDSGGMKAV